MHEGMHPRGAELEVVRCSLPFACEDHISSHTHHEQLLRCVIRIVPDSILLDCRRPEVSA